MNSEIAPIEPPPAEAAVVEVIPLNERESNYERQGFNARSTWRFSADHIQQQLAHCSAERKEALLWAFNWCISRGIWFDDFAKQMGYAPNTLYKVFTGKHTNPNNGEQYDVPEKLHKAILTWKVLELKKAQLGSTEFIITPTVRRIWNGCDLARESRTPVFLYGASHLGKTWAVTEYTHRNNHGRTILVRVPAKAGLNGLIRAWASAVGVSPKGDVPAMIIRIKNAMASNHLVIFDEFHQLTYTYRQQSFFACVEVIREVYDHVECGMVFSTTNLWRERLEASSKMELEQVFRRGVHQVQIGDIVRAEDLRPILDHVNLPWPAKKFTIDIGGVKDQPHEILRKLSRHGGLKSITERIRYARLLARKAKEDLDWKHFVHAHLIIDSNAQSPADDWE